MDEKSDTLFKPNLPLPEYSFIGKHQGNPAIGINLKPVEKEGIAEIAHAGFYTDYDGDFFFTCLNEFSKLYLQDWMANKQYKLSGIENCIIFVNRNNEYEVSINFPTLLKIIAKKETVKGTPIFKDDFIDIKELSFPTISFKQKCGVIYIFSHGWRRGLYFNFLPLVQDNDDIFEKYQTLFPAFYAYLVFPEIYRTDQQTLTRLYSDGWFPFVCIIGKFYEDLYRAHKNNVGISETITKIINFFNSEKIHDMEKRWFTKMEFDNHKKIIETGIERYLAGDYISAINNLYPRIEGVLRYLHLKSAGSGTVKDLLDTLQDVAEEKTTPYSLFLPKDFRIYLKTFFFSSFDLKTGKIDLSRPSLAHGVADESQFNRIAAFQAILILDQISYYL